MALRNAFGDIATDDSVKQVHTTQTDGSQKTRVIPASSGGNSVYRNISMGSGGVNIKSSAGQIYGWFLFNNSGSVRYVKLYNKGSSPSVGFDTPFMTIPLPAGGGANVNFVSGIAFSNGIGICATTGVTDGDTGSPGANEVTVNLIYY